MGNNQNIRSGNMKVSRMKEEISKRLAILELMVDPNKMSPELKRKLEHGHNFLEMIEEPLYVECKTVGALKRTIKRRRDMLLQKDAELSVNMPGHQLSIFEAPQELTYEQQEEIAREQMWLQQEIKWLHKCLGMCSNREYFK